FAHRRPTARRAGGGLRRLGLHRGVRRLGRGDLSEYLMRKADRAQDSGLYIMWLRIDAPCRVQIGALGEMAFPAGVYAYVGSAQRSRMPRIRRHLRSDKPLRWHFDYLRSHGSVFAVSLARGAKAEECGLARSLRAATRA